MGTAYVGILVPGLPTTPFLLLSAACFIRSSDKLYFYLINNRLFGKYIKDFQEHKAMSKNSKIFALTLMWIMILISVFVIIKKSYIKMLILAVGLIGSYFMGRIKVLSE
jgi:uncharacterized membrane protein YbaN (DUF454 family)